MRDPKYPDIFCGIASNNTECCIGKCKNKIKFIIPCNSIEEKYINDINKVYYSDFLQLPNILVCSKHYTNVYKKSRLSRIMLYKFFYSSDHDQNNRVFKKINDCMCNSDFFYQKHYLA